MSQKSSRMGWRQFVFGLLTLGAVGAALFFVNYIEPKSVQSKLAYTMKPSSFKPTDALPKEKEARAPASVSEDAPPVSAPVPKAKVADAAPLPGLECRQLEYRGEGLDRTKVGREEWARVIEQFHLAKRDLLEWLKTRKAELPAKTVASMEAQVRELRIQRAPSPEEPDLSWRGIGVYTEDTQGHMMVRLGGGFRELMEHQPARARFELTRLLAQAWAPCELQQMSGGPVWSSLLECLEVREDSACAVGSYSEAGWAVSTAIAAALAPPGCTIPAFAAGKAACVAKIPLSASVQEARL